MKSLRGFGPTRKKVKEYDHTSAKDSKDRKQQSRPESTPEGNMWKGECLS